MRSALLRCFPCCHPASAAPVSLVQGLMQLGEILRQAMASSHSNQRREELRLKVAFMGRNPPLGRGRELSRPGHCTATPLLHGTRWPGRLSWNSPRLRAARRAGILDPHRSKIDALLAKYPELSATRIHEEIVRGPDGYTGSACTLRRYLRTFRPTPRACLSGGQL